MWSPVFPIYQRFVRVVFFLQNLSVLSVSVSVCRRRNRLVLGSARASLRAALSKTRVQCAPARHSSNKHQRVKLAPVRCCDARCRLLRRHRRRVRPRAAHATPPARSRSRSQSCSGHPPRHGSNRPCLRCSIRSIFGAQGAEIITLNSVGHYSNTALFYPPKKIPGRGVRSGLS